MLLSKSGHQWKVNFSQLYNYLFVGIVSQDMLDELSISDLEFKEYSITSTESGNYEECGKASWANNLPLELEPTFNFTKQ